MNKQNKRNVHVACSTSSLMKLKFKFNVLNVYQRFNKHIYSLSIIAFKIYFKIKLKHIYIFANHWQHDAVIGYKYNRVLSA
jgi:hypothetical protein